MTFLPIADRELRVASRRQFTYWSRVAGAGFVLVIFGATMLILMQGGQIFGAGPGPIVFGLLKWLAFLFACSAGIFLTSDSVSEEKREGTLGLLFLTDLRGHDVVFGKLISQSLLAFYCLMAAFPVLALPLLMGGVTGAEFGRTMLVICNTLFLSLAVGMFVSSISREVMKAMNAALLVSFLIIVGLPWVDSGLAAGNHVAFKPILSIASPGYLFVAESGLKPSVFSFDLLLQHSVAWGFLVLSCVCVPRAWQEKTVTAKGARQSFLGWWRFGGRRARIALRRKLLPRNPILWVASRDRWMLRLIWLAIFISLGVLAWNLYVNWDFARFNEAGTGVRILLTVAVFLWVSTQSCRMFVDAVKNGAMELLLVSPVTPRQIVQGQWTVLWQTFLIPVLLIAALKISDDVHSIAVMRNSMRSAPATSGFNMYGYQVVWLITGLLNLFSNLLAMSWFGMWMGVTTRKTSIAALKTLCLVFILPWLGEMFVWGISMMVISQAGLPPGFMLSTGAIAACLLNLIKNALFIGVSRDKLMKNLRETVAQSGQATAPRPARAPLPRAVATSPASP